jgi:hypothetical protein
MSGREIVNAMRARGNFAKPVRTIGILDLVVAAVTVLALGCCCFLAINTIFRPTRPAGPAPVTVTASLDADALWTEQDAARCEASARQAATRPDSAVADDAALGIRAITDGGYAALATRMNCIASTKITRLCDPQQKEAFVAALNDYVGRFDLIVLGLGAQNGFVSLAGGMLGGEAEMGADVMDTQTQATLDYIDHYHARIVANLRQMARVELIRPEDFGAAFGIGASGTIVGILKDVVPTHNLCAQI